MRKLAIVLLFPSIAFAAPFLRSDPDPTNAADACVYQEGTSAAVSTPLVSGSCKADLAGVTVGAHTYQVWFTSAVWGIASAKVPFTYTRPSASATGPANLLISQ